MSDLAHNMTEKKIKELEQKLRKEYSKATKEVEEKIKDYLQRFKLKDKKWREWVARGEKTKEEYQQWRKGQILVGKRWEDLKNNLAQDMQNSNKIARKIINHEISDIYANNANWSMYRIEKELGINTGFTIYDAPTVERLISQDPKMLPPAGKKVSQAIRDGKARRWSRQVIQSAATQSILQGESIPQMARRLAKSVGDSNYKSAIRNARTMATGAQNAGRIDAHNLAREMGIDVADTWVATHDSRTRSSHRHLDGEIKGEDGFFSNGLRYPADPEGEPSEVYNCRCTIIGQIKGFERNVQGFDIRDDPDVGGMSYEEWKNSRIETSRPIDYQYKVGEMIKASYIRRYRTK